jgi:glycosyltransferase involved in cell wall biosynthesis
VTEASHALRERRVVVVTSSLSAGSNLLWDAVSDQVGGLTVIGARLGVDATPETEPVAPRATLRGVDLGRGLVYQHLVGLRRLLRSLRPDLVHVNRELWTVVAQEVVGLGCAVVVHGAENLWHHGNAVERRLRDRLVDRAVRRVAGYASWNRAGVAHVAARRELLGLAAIPTLVMPGVIPPETFHRTSWSPPSLEGGAPLEVLLVGRLVPLKGFDLVIEAAARVTGRPVHVSVCGEGPAEADLVALARARHVDLELHGWRTEAETADLMAASHVQVQPSRSTPDLVEQFGRSVAEAMTVGLPCVVSTSGELSHVVAEDDRVVFDEDDVAGLSAILQRLSDHPGELTELSAVQRRVAEERYAPATAGASLAAFWSEVLR